MYTLELKSEEDKQQIQTLLFAALKSPGLDANGSVAAAAWMQTVAALAPVAAPAPVAALQPDAPADPDA